MSRLWRWGESAEVRSVASQSIKELHDMKGSALVKAGLRVNPWAAATLAFGFSVLDEKFGGHRAWDESIIRGGIGVAGAEAGAFVGGFACGAATAATIEVGGAGVLTCPALIAVGGVFGGIAGDKIGDFVAPWAVKNLARPWERRFHLRLVGNVSPKDVIALFGFGGFILFGTIRFPKRWREARPSEALHHRIGKWYHTIRMGPAALAGGWAMVLFLIYGELRLPINGLAILLFFIPFSVALLLMHTAYFFNWPKFVVPPGLRNEPGVFQEWQERRRKKRMASKTRHA